ncbi:hypothetical protein R6Z07M_014368 [Ovis aries]
MQGAARSPAGPALLCPARAARCEAPEGPSPPAPRSAGASRRYEHFALTEGEDGHSTHLSVSIARHTVGAQDPAGGGAGGGWRLGAFAAYGRSAAEAGLQDKMAAKQPPPLMKKHSQTDLVSRLKTRKILGVGGEDDDGEVHRSKISQVLGNEIKFAVREPLGLRVWQFVSAVLFSGIAIMALAFPDQLYDAVFDGAQVTSKTPIRLYGGALLSISLIMWNALYTAEKVIIRWTLLTEACYFSVQFLVVTATLAETGLVSEGILLLLASRLLFVAISVYYYYQVGRKPKKV